jgi:hypothetical protein
MQLPFLFFGGRKQGNSAANASGTPVKSEKFLPSTFARSKKKKKKTRASAMPVSGRNGDDG